MPIPHGIETREYVLALKMGDEQAWDRLIEDYSGELNKVIVNTLVDADMPYHWAIREPVQHRLWIAARNQIRYFRFNRQGDVYRWLRALQREVVNAYLIIESEMFIEFLREKDEIAWERIFQVYRPALLNVSRSKLLSMNFHLALDPSEDIAQDTWMTARQQIDAFEFKGPKSLLSWLCTIQRNNTMNYYRKERIRQHVAIEDELDASDDASDIEALITDRERLTAYQRELARIIRYDLPNLKPGLGLNDTTKIRIITLFFKQFQKSEQVAKQCHVPKKAVYDITREVKSILRQRLAAYIDSARTTDEADNSPSSFSVGD